MDVQVHLLSFIGNKMKRPKIFLPAHLNIIEHAFKTKSSGIQLQSERQPSVLVMVMVVLLVKGVCGKWSQLGLWPPFTAINSTHGNANRQLNVYIYTYEYVYSVSINEWPPFTGSISNCAVPCSSCGWEPFSDSRDKKRMALVYHFNHHILPHSQIPQLFSHSLPAFLQFKLTHPR